MPKSNLIYRLKSGLFQISSSVYLIFASIWTLLLLYFSLIPARSIASLHLWSFPGLDKVVHVVFYLLFGFLWSMSISQHNNRTSWILISGIGLGIFMEAGQYYMMNGRSFELLDILANAIGAYLGVLVYKRIAAW